MMTEPTLEDRGERHYVAIRTQVTMQELGATIPRLLGDVFAWLDRQDIPPGGAPLARYLVIDMVAELDIELGVPVASAVPGDGRVVAGVLPAGRYAALIYTGPQNGIAANAALQAWAAERGIAWQKRPTPKGEAWGARVESYLTDPAAEPDPERWETEVAYLVAE
jgi:effector-binding domain-containing protein